MDLDFGAGLDGSGQPRLALARRSKHWGNDRSLPTLPAPSGLWGESFRKLNRDRGSSPDPRYMALLSFANSVNLRYDLGGLATLEADMTRGETGMIRQWGWLVAIGLVLTGWSWGAGAIALPSPSAQPTLQQLQQMPRNTQIGNWSYRLELSLWRDQMPILPPGGRPLLTQIRLIASPVGIGQVAPQAEFQTDPKDAPKIEAIWTIQGDRVWRSTQFDAPKQTKATIETTARSGPKLEPKSKADVVVQLADRSGKRYWLRAPGQRVMAVQ
jgi:hypothetical protein